MVRAVRMTVAITVVVAAASLLHAGLLPAPAAYADHGVPGVDGGLTVVFIGLDTKGDSTLIMLPNGKTILIDGGMPGSYPNLKATLQHHGVETIDTMIASHPDQDHVAGLNSLLDDDSFQIKEVLINPTPKDTKTYKTFLESARGEKVAYASERILLDESVDITILGPPESLIRSERNASLANSNSIITLLEYGDMEFLFTADATYTTERWLIDNYPADVLDIDIMNGPHHGSKYASTADFIRATTPEVVVFSANRDNQYGHPHPEAAQRYQSAGIGQAYTTYENNITIRTDGTGCSLMLGGADGAEMPCFDGVLTLSSSSSSPQQQQQPPSTTAPDADGSSNGNDGDGDNAGHPEMVDVTGAGQSAVEVTMADRDGTLYVKHVVRPTGSPVQIQLVDGPLEDLTVTSAGAAAATAPTADPVMTGNRGAVVLGPSEAETVVQYVLRDVVRLTDGLWTLDFSYPWTTTFLVPEDLEMVFVNGNVVLMGEKSGFNCHGCQMTLEYSLSGPATLTEVVWEENRFDVEIRSFSQIRDFGFDQPARALTFGTVQDGQQVTAVIPQELLGSPYSVLLDGQMIQFREYFNNGTHAWLTMSPASAGEVSIIGTTVIPEFPAAVTILLMAGLFVAVLVMAPAVLARMGRGVIIMPGGGLVIGR